MQLHISPSFRHVKVLPRKGVREFIKVKVGSRRLSYRMVIYSLLFLTFLLRFIFVLGAVNTIDGQTKCSTLGNFLAYYFMYLSDCTFISIYPARRCLVIEFDALINLI